MTKFVVLDAEGEEVEVEADSYQVDGDGFLIFSTVVDAWSPEEWHTVSEEVEDEDEDETVEDLVDRLIETFDGDLTVLHALANLRAVLSDDDEDETEADEDETEDEAVEDLIDRLEETFSDDDLVFDVLDLLRDAVDAEDR